MLINYIDLMLFFIVITNFVNCYKVVNYFTQTRHLQNQKMNVYQHNHKKINKNNKNILVQNN
jgi:hypothetical protein